jgi:uncharacterized protein (DUF849 family)
MATDYVDLEQWARRDFVRRQLEAVAAAVAAGLTGRIALSAAVYEADAALAPVRQELLKRALD